MVVTSASDAEEQAAFRMEYALKMLVSIPALLSTVFNHRATVDDDTGLCGLIMAISNCVLPFGERLSVVFFHTLSASRRGRVSCSLRT